MTFRQLEAFLAVARERSFSRAASRIHLSQPTLSEHIRELERELGKRLFSRRGRDATLTEAGRVFQPHAVRVASAADDVLRLSITLRPGNSGGALVNARGQVVGIPHMVTGNGLALAVASRRVREFLGGATGESEGDNLRWV